jgi:hypothetical protein
VPGNLSGTCRRNGSQPAANGSGGQRKRKSRNVFSPNGESPVASLLKRTEGWLAIKRRSNDSVSRREVCNIGRGREPFDTDAHVNTKPMKADAAQSFSGGQITGKHRSFIREQKYALLSHRKNHKPKARKGLKEFLVANRRLNTAYILKESFKPAIEYGSELPSETRCSPSLWAAGQELAYSL